jgi:1-acyl-sn-glycerol-3-phosphate acyltransferase
MLMFPEGTTTNGTILIKFKRGENQTLVQVLFEIFQMLLAFALACLGCQIGGVCTFPSIPIVHIISNSI